MSVGLRLSLTVTLMSLVLVACGSEPAPSPGVPSGSPSSSPSPAIPSGTPSPHPTPSPTVAALLLKVTTEGGFINPAATLAALPTVEVLADGRILTPAASAGETTPLVQPVDVRDVGAAGAAAILAAIQQAGLDRLPSSGPGVPGDSGTTVFTVIVDGETTTTRLAAGGLGVPGRPGPGPEGSGDPEQVAAFALLDRLLDPTDDWGAAATPAFTFDPTAYRVYEAPRDGPTDPGSAAPEAWPLATPLDEFGTPAILDAGIPGLRQGVVLGDDAAALAPLFDAAEADTPFTSNGKPYTLFVRPLLPDELGG